MIGPLLWLIYLLFWIPNVCLWFGVNMGFSDEDRILKENLYVFKGYGAKKTFRNF